MRHYTLMCLIAVMPFVSFSAQASGLLASQGQQQAFDWQTEWGAINFGGSPDPGIDSANLPPKKDIKTNLLRWGGSTKVSDLSEIKTYNIDLNGDSIADVIVDGSAYFQQNQKSGSPICTADDGCFVNVYLFDQNTSLASGILSDGKSCTITSTDGTTCTATKYNTHLVYSQQVLGWNVVSAANFQSWAAGKPYQFFNTSAVFVVRQNSTAANPICNYEELSYNNNDCIKYYQYSGDLSAGTMEDLYHHADVANDQPTYATLYTPTPFPATLPTLGISGEILGSGFGYKLFAKSGTQVGTYDVQFQNMTYTPPKGVSNPPDFQVSVPASAGASSLYAFHVENAGGQGIFIPANSGKEFNSFIDAVLNGKLPGVTVGPEQLRFIGTGPSSAVCPAVVTSATSVPWQRYCQSSTGDYRSCAACQAAAKANAPNNGWGYPDDWALGCQGAQPCQPNACYFIAQYPGQVNGWVTADLCTSVLSDFAAGNNKASRDATNTAAAAAYDANYAIWTAGGSIKLATAAADANMKFCTGLVADICADPTLCLAGDSMIALPDGTTKRIDEVKVGDVVLGFVTPKGKLKSFKVKTLAATPKQPAFKINGTLSITPGHRVIIADGTEVHASALKVGDVLLAGDRSMVKITTIETLPAEDTVYNLVLDKPAIGFVADGFRVMDYEH